MNSVRIEFKKGGVFKARLLEKEAPKTCSTIKDGSTFPVSIPP
jgi:hypothetical protein